MEKELQSDDCSSLCFMISVALFFKAAFAFILSYAMTPAATRLALAMGALDAPDGYRKINERPMPRLGGLGFFVASALILFPAIKESPTVAGLLAGGTVLMVGGVADDTYGLSPSAKLLIQTVASAVALAFTGIPEYLSFFGIFRIALSGGVGALIALVRLVFTVNAVNFTDGLDGLASGISATAFLSLAVYGAHFGSYSSAAAALILAFSVLGFIPHNRYRAKVFMGDCGSQFLGLSIALLSLGVSRDGGFTLETALFLTIPTLDTAFAVIRRTARGKSPFSADKGHLHHLLLRLGFPHPVAVRILVAASALVSAITLVIVKSQRS